MFKDKLKKLRLESGLKQKELGEKLGLSASAIGMYEQGRRDPDNETLMELSKIFDVSVDYLLGNEATKNKCLDNKNENPIFENAQDAMAFILKQPSIMAYGVPDLTDEEIIEFANDILKHIELVSYKYKK